MNFTLNINLNDDNRYFKGDTIVGEVTVNESIAEWEIRAELYDKAGHRSRIATANVTGGSDDQICVVDAVNGVFTLTWAEGETTDFDNDVWMEIERTNSVGNKKTIFQSRLFLNNEMIQWDSVDE